MDSVLHFSDTLFDSSSLLILSLASVELAVPLIICLTSSCFFHSPYHHQTRTSHSSSCVRVLEMDALAHLMQFEHLLSTGPNCNILRAFFLSFLLHCFFIIIFLPGHLNRVFASCDFSYARCLFFFSIAVAGTVLIGWHANRIHLHFNAFQRG
ncbi:hypothetical protein BJY00DRAFT_273888 [Aspergillus carlsbadensis]|nr:hypothetical protein BJY00DRAFT_273888 [Aspergillus carlsbadensis]